MITASAAAKPGMRADIQGLRAVAVIMVVLSHLPQWGKFAGGFVGVDLFFVISGFVITRLLVKNNEKASGVASGYGAFLLRRVIRLVPALFVMLCAGLILGYFLAPPAEFSSIWGGALWSEAFLSNFYYLLNFDSYWNPEVLRNPFLHTWSLGIEFQTYLVLPLLAYWLFSHRTPSRLSLTRSTWMIGSFSVLSLILFIWLVAIRSADIRGFGPVGLAFYTPFPRFWEFGLGAIAALVSAQFVVTSRVINRVAPLGWALIVGGTVLSHLAGQLSLAVIPLAIGVMLLLWGGESERTYFGQRALSAKPAVWLGDRSYSFYLWHWPLLMVAIWLMPGWMPGPFLVLLIALLLAELSYRFLEQRIRYQSSVGVLRRWRGTAIIVLFTTALLVLTSAIPPGWSTSNQIGANIDLPEPSVSIDDVNFGIAGCDFQRLEVHCDYFGPDVPEIVVIGDSLGYRAFPAVALAAQRNGYNASQLWTGGCSIEYNSCPTFVYDYLARSRVAGVIVATNFDRESSVINGSEKAAGLMPLCPPEIHTVDCELHQRKVSEFTDKAKLGLAQLLTFSNHLLVSLPFPQQQLILKNCLNPSLALRSTETDPNCISTSREWQSERQGLYPAAITAVTAGVPGIFLWDPQEYLCTATDCPGITKKRETLMDDAVHWSQGASRFLFPAFNSFIAGLKK